jgi:hypothetical protein
MATTTAAFSWKTLNPLVAKEISDARLQFHYAAQFAAAMGISYLTPRADDGHTNLGWDPRHEALRSREVRALSHAIHVAVRPADLTLMVLLDGSIGQRIPLPGLTIREAETSLRAALAAAGVDSRRLTLRRHYQLPPHPVAGGNSFDTTRSEDFAELSNWYGNAAAVLAELCSRTGGSEVRCWPHHFDIATLATIAPGRTSGAGMLPGDAMCPEPYFYVNANPAPRADQLTARVEGGGVWNTDEWTGAILIGSRLDPDGSTQAAQVRAFLVSAAEACARLLRD